jgi:HTTM domain
MIGPLRQPVRAWNAWWFGPVPAYPLAAFRVLLGLFLLAYLLPMLPHVPVMFAARGVYTPFLLPDVAPPPAVAWAAFTAMLVLTVLFTLGVRTGVVTPLLLAAFGYHYLLNLALKNTAYDRLIIYTLAFLCFGELDKVWSLGRRNVPSIEAARGGDRVCAWPQRMVMLQVALLYFGSGLWKLFNPYWHDAGMLYNTFQGAWATPAAYWVIRLGLPKAAFAAMAWSVIVFELAATFGLFVPRLRVVFMAVGVLFHLGNWVFLDIPEFMFVPLAYVLFLPADRVRAAGERLLQCPRILIRRPPV